MASHMVARGGIGPATTAPTPLNSNTQNVATSHVVIPKWRPRSGRSNHSIAWEVGLRRACQKVGIKYEEVELPPPELTPGRYPTKLQDEREALYRAELAEYQQRRGLARRSPQQTHLRQPR